MNKKLLYILAIFSFFYLSFEIQNLCAVQNEQEESSKLEEIDFSDIDFDNLEDLEEKETKIKSPGFKEKLSILSEVLKEMTFKEKISFLSALTKEQIKENKKKVIITSIILAGLSGSIIVYKKNKKG